MGKTDERRRPSPTTPRAIELHGAPSEQVAKALFNRGFTHGHEDGRTTEAIADCYPRAIELPRARHPSRVATALNNRGATHRLTARTAEAIADYTRAIEPPGALPEQVAMALNNRGASHGKAWRTVQRPPRTTPAPSTCPPHRLSMPLRLSTTGAHRTGKPGGRRRRSPTTPALLNCPAQLPRRLPWHSTTGELPREAGPTSGLCCGTFPALFTLPDERAARNASPRPRFQGQGDRERRLRRRRPRPF